jgi:hypothetical protein
MVSINHKFCENVQQNRRFETLLSNAGDVNRDGAFSKEIRCEGGESISKSGQTVEQI